MTAEGGMVTRVILFPTVRSGLANLAWKHAFYRNPLSMLMEQEMEGESRLSACCEFPGGGLKKPIALLMLACGCLNAFMTLRRAAV